MLIIGQNIYQIKVITTMMENYDESVEINNNLDWSFVFYHLDRILISGGRNQTKIMC